MIHINRTDHITFYVTHDPLPDTILTRRYPHLQHLLDAIDPSMGTYAALDGNTIDPDAKLSLDATGLLEVMYEGVKYHATI